MVLGQNRQVVGTFYNRIDVERAVNELKSSGFSVAQISVVAQDTYFDEQLGRVGISDDVWYQAKDGNATSASITGSILGAIGGCLVGIGLLAVPGVGLVLGVGTSGAALGTTLAGAGIGAVTGGLIEALATSRRTSAAAQSDHFFLGKYLLIVDGTDDEVRRAESILKM
jgi:hypothetical protein